MRADIQTAYSITTLPDDCVGGIVKHITEDANDENTNPGRSKIPDLVSLSALSRISKTMMKQLAPWMNPQDHACRLIDQVFDHPYPAVRTMKLVARFAAFFPDNLLENEIRVSCALTTNKLVNELLMIARAGETMNPSAQDAIALDLKQAGVLDGLEGTEYTKKQYQLGINVVAEILATCGIQIYEFERSEEKVLLAASLLDDGLKALSMLTRPLRIAGFLRVAKSLQNEFSAQIAQQFLDHSASFIPSEWDAEFMASAHGAECFDGLSIFMKLPMPDSRTIEEAVMTLLRSHLKARSAADPHWTNLSKDVFDLSLSLYRSLRLKNQADSLVQQLTALGIFTENELLIMDAVQWSGITNKSQARLEFLRLMENASIPKAAGQ